MSPHQFRAGAVTPHGGHRAAWRMLAVFAVAEVTLLAASAPTFLAK